ncbi:MAG: amidohydrolase family protein [Deferrisomatales bacterium]|nr:amidohydrolase family protein [Deferrisomatales bacterium]
MPVIDVHTHMLSDAWLGLLKARGGPRYTIGEVAGGQQAVHLGGAPFMTLTPGMFDYALRLRDMDAAGVDIAIVSLTCPNVYWGTAETSAEAARIINDDMAAAQNAFPGRIRWFCSLPWQHGDLALDELARACDRGAVGVMVLANVAGTSLTEPGFAPIWAEINRRRLPVLVHPTVPQGAAEMALGPYNLIASVGFMADTTLAVTRLIFDGFLDRYPDLKLIAAHGGGTLPYIAGRLDRCYDQMPACRARIGEPPSSYLRRIYYDTVVYTPEALALCITVAGADRVLYGSDYPHNIGDMKGCLARVDGLPSEQRRGVRGENARRIFGL